MHFTMKAWAVVFFLMIVWRAGIASVFAVQPQGDALTKPGIALTFDDRRHISDWVKQLPLLARYQVRVTFFIERPDALTTVQKEQLMKLAVAGHEIASHGFRHVRAVSMSREKGGEVWIREEIAPAEAALNSIGIEVKSFAYPMSEDNDETNRLLQSRYRHARSGRGLPRGKTLAGQDVFFTPLASVAGRFCLIGKGLDGADEEWLDLHVFPALQRTRDRGELLVLYAHNIAEAFKGHHIKPQILEMILKRAQELELVFYTFADLPSRWPESN